MVWKKKETDFTIRLLPLGGYVVPNPFGYKVLPLYKKWLFLLGGVTVNLCLFITACGFLSTNGFIIGMVKAVKLIPSMFNIIHFSDFVGKEAAVTNQVTAISTIANSEYNFWLIVAGINVMLFVVNLLPIPIFDGGRLIIDSVETILLKLRIPERVIEKVKNPLLLGSWVLLLLIPLMFTLVDDLKTTPWITIIGLVFGVLACWITNVFKSKK